MRCSHWLNLIMIRLSQSERINFDKHGQMNHTNPLRTYDNHDINSLVWVRDGICYIHVCILYSVNTFTLCLYIFFYGYTYVYAYFTIGGLLNMILFYLFATWPCCIRCVAGKPWKQRPLPNAVECTILIASLTEQLCDLLCGMSPQIKRISFVCTGCSGALFCVWHDFRNTRYYFCKIPSGPLIISAISKIITDLRARIYH